jgi:hypothetical protein
VQRDADDGGLVVFDVDPLVFDSELGCHGGDLLRGRLRFNGGSGGA